MNGEEAALRASGDGIDYLDFEVEIRRDGKSLVSQVLESPAGQAEGPCAITDSILQEAQQLFPRLLRSTMLQSASEAAAASGREELIRALGASLFQALFPQPVRDLWQRSWGTVEHADNVGLRLRIRLNLDKEELARLHGLPWEFLWDGDFLAYNRRISITRYLDRPLPERRPLAPYPLRILLVISRPSDRPPLPMLEDERRMLEALGGEARGVEIVTASAGSLKELREQLLKGCHVLHFTGHGHFSPKTGEGALLFTAPDGNSQRVTGARLINVIRDMTSLRLVFVNACETARAGVTVPFAGIASALLAAGVPAVIAMQFPVTDHSANVFAGTVYRRLVAGDPLDAAVAEGRLALQITDSIVPEWGTPTLFLRAPDGRLFEPRPLEPPPAKSTPANPSPAATSAPKPPPVELPPSEPSRVTWINLSLLAAFGVAVSAWLYVFTDTFPTVSTALTLGGVFTCLSVLLAVAPKAVKDRIIKVFQEKVLESRRTRGVLALLAVLCTGAASFRGILFARRSEEWSCKQCKVTLLPYRGSGDRIPGPGESLVVQAESKSKWLVWVWPFGRSYLAYNAELPPRRVKVYPIVPTFLELPGDFEKPALVRIQVEKESRLLVNGTGSWATVSKDGEKNTYEYKGGPIWVGKALPNAMWPQEFRSLDLPVENGECLEVDILNSDQDPIARVAQRIKLEKDSFSPVDLVVRNYERHKGDRCL